MPKYQWEIPLMVCVYRFCHLCIFTPVFSDIPGVSWIKLMIKVISKKDQ